MKARGTNSQFLEAQVKNLKDRLAAAQADIKRVADNRIASERKLAELGRQVTGLTRDLAEIAQRNATVGDKPMA